MKESVVITEKEFKKGERIFKEYSSINWIPCKADEQAVTLSIKSSGSKIVVLGVERYKNSLYAALSQNAEPDPALIARHGVGFDGIDLHLCQKNNIFLCITPGALDQSVAEHTMALLLCTARNIPCMDRQMHNNRYTPETGFELFKKPLGIAGFGNIARKVALIASRGFGMPIYAYDIIPLTKQAAKNGMSKNEFLSYFGIIKYFTDFDSFLRAVNIITIHMPVNDSTKCFFDSDTFEKMNDSADSNDCKNGSILINTSRGALIDEKALYIALSSKKLKAAAIDVYKDEPYKPYSSEYDLRKLSNIILTPHTASDTIEANENMGKNVMKNIQHFLKRKYEHLTTVLPASIP